MTGTLLRGGRIVDSTQDLVADVLIQGETIAQVGDIQNIPPGTRSIDCAGRIIMPGMIDPHTHMGVPIKTEYSADDFASGSRAAIHGGVTTILDFSILQPDEGLRQSVQRRMSEAESSLCDVGIHCNLTREDPKLLAEIPGLIGDGITSFKAFTTYPEAGMMLSYVAIQQAAQVIADHNGLLMVHAEDNDVISAATQPLKAQDHRAPRYHGLSRPAEAEIAAINALGPIARETGCQIYIVHLNTAAGLEAARRWELAVETCPQYLFLSDERYEQTDGRMYVASPPLRSPDDTRALWEAIQNGAVDCIGSDHCAFNTHQKPTDIPFHEIPNGLGGVETSFPLLFQRFMEEGWDLKLIARMTSGRAAEIFGLHPRKGVIAPGSDADLLIMDPNAKTDKWEQSTTSQVDWQAYSGFPAIFPQDVFRRGAHVVRNKQISATSMGQFLPMQAGKFSSRYGRQAE